MICLIQQVNQGTNLSRFITALQWERAAVSLAIFLESKSGTSTDLGREYARTDKAIRRVVWRRYGPERIFENNLRFQIRLDDFRYIDILLHKYSQQYRK